MKIKGTILGVLFFILGSCLPALGGTGFSRLSFYGRWDLRTPDHAITVNNGSYIKVRFKGEGITATFDVSENRLQQPSTPTLVWKMDKGEWREGVLASVVPLAEKLGPGNHDLIFMIRGFDPMQSRWFHPLVSSVNFTGFRVTNGEALPVPTEKEPHLEFLGDSITEGILVHSETPTSSFPRCTDARLAYPCQASFALGASWRQVGFGTQGITRRGTGGVPTAIDAFNYFYQDCPRDDWQADAVIINQGSNDENVPPQIFQPGYATFLKNIRKAYPKAALVAMIPLDGSHPEEIKAVVDEFVAKGDHQVFLIDASHWLAEDDFTDGVHPNITGHRKVTERLTAELRKLLPTLFPANKATPSLAGSSSHGD